MNHSRGSGPIMVDFPTSLTEFISHLTSIRINKWRGYVASLL